ncbi:fatty acid desaturase family protein [Arsenicibacter rosenii]|uniref:Acyl-CoA desaturase n=1 Tax=Arsenicibacter rosenii TaxID=1750698 RepID=A0A1S2VF70_9BACT|nr:acyl-CoA desaturase [Arsenicibacter rosenii]OIN57401.1 acyl-CoA desaturase [Arsenicibacter rosenii]
MATKLKFAAAGNLSFFSTLRTRVDAYFTEQAISPHANRAMWVKTCFFLTGYFTLYLLILSNQFSALGMLGFCLLLGIFAACIGFNISHDALHGAFSSSPRINRILGNSFYLLGASPYVWKITHNIVHHTYTNIPGHDEDIDIAPGLVRLDPQQPHHLWHMYQHIYSFPLYMLASLSWVFRKDYIKFFKEQIGQHKNNNHPRAEYLNLFAGKALYYTAFLLLPYLLLDLTIWQVLAGFVAMHLAEGLVLGLVFQLAHVVEGTAFPLPDASGLMTESWAIHQLQTTANFAPRSRLAAFFCGGLNRQIEHHLFPKVCHIHYPALTKIVRETAGEFGLPYLENASFGTALYSHYCMLRRLGQKS